MHTFGDNGAGVPAFLAKLWRLVDDPDTNNLIYWSPDGRSFVIQNQAQFARELLPLNYKHNNMASFIRQLNMYGFHKITSIDNGGLKFDRDEMEFSHPCFRRNCSYLLEHIKRKIATSKNIDDKSGVKTEAVTKVLQDVKAMRGRQDSLDSRFSVMKQENEALWREIASLRQKHAKQQQIVNKLIQFLITIVQPSRNMSGVKRHMQLMINDTPIVKTRTNSETESECGPVIHELREGLLDEVIDNDDDEEEFISLRNKERRNMESPNSTNSMGYDYSNHSADDINAKAASPSPINMATKNAGFKIKQDASASIVQSVGPDGSRIVYHVTEVPDTHQQDHTTTTTANSFGEENVLTTPMVREQMERAQIKHKNKQRRKQSLLKEATTAALAGKKVCQQPISYEEQKYSIKQQQQQQQNILNIKSEREQLDPMMFLNDYTDSRIITPDPRMLSPNHSDDSHQSGLNVGNMNTADLPAATTPTNDTLIGASSELYSPNHFITGEIPADIFEDSSLISGDKGDFGEDVKLNLQQQFGRSTVTGGNFSNFIAGNSVTSNNGASTSAAAAAAAAAANSNNDETGENAAKGSISNGKNMAVTKYSKNSNSHDEIMRLSSPDDVHGHLENVQDELETLKDLLRGDNYSLDTNTLMGLFNDSDLLGPYGLSMEPEIGGASNEKKGSELMTYQPLYDLSDIMEYNDNNDNNDETSNQTEQQGSTLNTPHHD